MKNISIILRLLLFFVLLSANTGILCSSAHASPPQAIRLGNKSFQCAPSIAQPIDGFYDGKWNFNPQLAAGAYGIYAAASYDAYEPRPNGFSRAFHVADNDPELKSAYGKSGWIRAEPRHENSSGLSYDVYHQESPERLDVMVAYRGTDDGLDRDWIANLSWITQWLNPWDQYRQARNEFEGIMERAIERADGKPVAFLATGHSLGGGLAQHVAHVHPCTTAIVFNASFVTNTTLYENFKPTVIKVYEKGDFFEFFAGKIDNSNTLAIYRLRLTLKDGAVYNHNMERFAAGALRMAVDCTQNTLDCQIPNQQAVISATLFCDRYVKLRYDLGDRDALQMKEKTEFCPSHRDIKIVRNQEQ